MFTLGFSLTLVQLFEALGSKRDSLSIVNHKLKLDNLSIIEEIHFDPTILKLVINSPNDTKQNMFQINPVLPDNI